MTLQNPIKLWPEILFGRATKCLPRSQKAQAYRTAKTIGNSKISPWLSVNVNSCFYAILNDIFAPHTQIELSSDHVFKLTILMGLSLLIFSHTVYMHLIFYTIRNFKGPWKLWFYKFKNTWNVLENLIHWRETCQNSSWRHKTFLSVCLFSSRVVLRDIKISRSYRGIWIGM